MNDMICDEPRGQTGKEKRISHLSLGFSLCRGGRWDGGGYFPRLLLAQIKVVSDENELREHSLLTNIVVGCVSLPVMPGVP